MKTILSDADLEHFLSERGDERVIVYKHSTTCPISAAAYQQVEQFEAEHGDVPIGLIRVIEERPISLKFAEQVGVPHASPQAIVMQGGKPIWHASHYAITHTALASALRD